MKRTLLFIALACLLSHSSLFAVGNITISSGCLSGITLVDAGFTLNGKAAWTTASTVTYTIGGASRTDNVYIYYAITGGADGSVNNPSASFPVGGCWVITEGSSAGIMYNTTSQGTLPKATGWTQYVGSPNLSCASASSTTLAGAVLPVELINFGANTEGPKNNLTWATASELNSKAFDIERSTDGKTFTSIGTVKAANKASTYQFVDNQPFATSYYRLRQIDFDGTETYSKIVSVEQTGKGSSKTRIFPTHTEGVVHIQNDDLTMMNVAVFNAMGQLVYANKSTNSVDLSGMVAGLYFVEVQTGNGKVVEKVFKK